MSRLKIPPETQTKVLVECARRCCACFGLNQELTSKAGQIAHINGNSSDNSIANLAFLCLEHHDQLDTKTSQSKGLSRDEIRYYRAELTAYVARSRQSVHGRNSRLEGQWESWNGFRSISIGQTAGGSFKVVGMAIDNPEKEAPNIGTFDEISPYNDELILLRSKGLDVEIRHIGSDRIHVTDKSQLGTFGMNVHFDGDYTLAGEVADFPAVSW